MASFRKLHKRFEVVLPRIVRHARVMFRFIKCYHTKEDKIQEVRGYCWKWVRATPQTRQEVVEVRLATGRLRVQGRQERPQDRGHDGARRDERDQPAAARLLHLQAARLLDGEHQPARRSPDR